MIRKSDDMPTVLYKSRFLIAIIGAAILLLSGCKKAIEATQRSLAEQYFETNILNRDYTVRLATNNGTDLTSQYTGYTFKLLKNTLLDGPMTAVIGGTTYTGTWQCNEDYGKLTITLPATPSVFVFLTREWRFTKKDVTVMELAPWGSTDPIALHMERL